MAWIREGPPALWRSCLAWYWEVELRDLAGWRASHVGTKIPGRINRRGISLQVICHPDEKAPWVELFCDLWSDSMNLRVVYRSGVGLGEQLDDVGKHFIAIVSCQAEGELGG